MTQTLPTSLLTATLVFVFLTVQSKAAAYLYEFKGTILFADNYNSAFTNRSLMALLGTTVGDHSKCTT